MNLAIIPLAITMLAGPQIMSAIIFVTSTRPVRTSAAFIIGVAIAATVGVLIAINVASLLDNTFSLGDSSDSGSTGHIVQYLLVGLLIALAVKNYIRRETVEPPRWLGTLQRADAKRAFSVGLLVILLMPSDIIVMLTVGVNLVQNNAGLLAALPFIVATVLIAPPAALLVVLQTCTASCAKDTRLDERAQLARKHHRLRCVHPLDPLIALCGRSNPLSMRASFPRKRETTAASTPYP